MLIFTRRVGESIDIGDDITVTVVSVNGKSARIGVNAPKHIEVHREEIYRQVQADRKGDQKAG